MHLLILIIILILILLCILYLYSNKLFFTNTDDNLITFIIPTIGRATLIDSINSIISQTNKNWKAIVVFDGIEPTINIDDDRIKIIKINKTGNSNHAGRVRNEGIKIATTKWIAFLDDDDYIKDDYIDTFYEELKYKPDLDVLIFRMVWCDNRIIPSLNTDNIYKGDVGISFIMKKSLFDNGFIFYPSNTEDFDLLNKIKNNKYKIMISPYIKYFVRCNNSNINYENGSRIIL
jgi:glycosyltransferase involved in cell wall biosynthesis